MSIVHSAFYDPSGRVGESYVYMLLCPDTEHIYIKVGMSMNPIKRLLSLKTGCPIEPETLAVMKVQSFSIAVALERALHTALDQWRNNGEWFKFKAEDKAKFNAIWKVVVSAFTSDSVPLKWTMLDPQELLKQANQRRIEKLKRKSRDRVNAVRLCDLRRGYYTA